MYTCTQISTHTHKHMSTHIFTHAPIHVPCRHIFTGIYTHVSTYGHTFQHMQLIHMCLHTRLFPTGTPSPASTPLSLSSRCWPEASASTTSPSSGTPGTGWTSASSQWREHGPGGSSWAAGAQVFQWVVVDLTSHKAAGGVVDNEL